MDYLYSGHLWETQEFVGEVGDRKTKNSGSFTIYEVLLTYFYNFFSGETIKPLILGSYQNWLVDHRSPFLSITQQHSFIFHFERK